MRRTLNVILVNLAILGVFLVVLELLFGTWFSREHALYRFALVRDTVIERDNPLPGGRARITYTRDAFGFRGLDGHPVDDIDILTVGGSTTDQRWLDDTETFQAQLASLYSQQGRPLTIVNAGVDGQSTFGHIENFRSWFDKVPGLRARYVLYYIGINDALKLQRHERFDLVADTSTLAGPKGWIKAHSALYQVYRVARGAFSDKAITHALDRRNIAERPPFAEAPAIADPLTPEMQASLAGLRERVAQLNALTEAFGAKAIFVTQRSARWTRRDGRIYGIATYQPDFFEAVLATLPDWYRNLNGVDFYNFERLVADSILSECARQGAICWDLMQDVDFDVGSDFYDPVHTTPAGSGRIAGYLFSQLTASIYPLD